MGTSRYPDVMPLRHDNPDWIRAWKALYGYRSNDMQPAHLRELLQTKRSLIRQMGDAGPRYVLDKAGNGDGPFFNNNNANPGLLEAAIGSQPLRQTNFASEIARMVVRANAVALYHLN